ncbi:DUF5518 domain-containing protein [Natrinema marinum]|uniref:DUF5518 domain-containing protein n=1 Tax=Natrinema marinum TaxID=2961598 RepID=UPI0020C85CC1|nr:DUF5518 domain-containing protein [Natrinema marinum]
MTQVNSLSERLDEAWQYALLGGLASLPFTATSYWQTGSKISLGAVFFGGILAGFLAKRKTGTSSDVGVRVGIIGGLPAVWLIVDLLAASGGLDGPLWFIAIGLIFLIGFAAVVTVFAFGLAALIGTAGARVGGWLADFGSRRRPPGAGS